MEIAWSRVSSVSGYRDGACGVCVCEDRVYGVGFDESHGYGKMRYRVEAYSARDGKPLAAWADEKSYSFASLFTCIGLGERVYAFGATSKFWSTIVFDKDLSVVKRVDVEKPHLVPFSAIALDNYVYVAGSSTTPEGLTSLSVVKVSRDDLSVVKSFSTDMDRRGAGSYALAYSKKTGQLVVGGFVKTDAGLEWLVVFLNDNLELVKVAKPGIRGTILSLTVDAGGFIYAVDGYRVVKMSENGEVLVKTEMPQALKVYASHDKASPIGTDVAVASSTDFYLLRGEKMFMVVGSAKLSREPQVLSAFAGPMDADKTNVYLALTQIASEDNWNWVIFALRPKGKRR